MSCINGASLPTMSLSIFHADADGLRLGLLLLHSLCADVFWGRRPLTWAQPLRSFYAWRQKLLTSVAIAVEWCDHRCFWGSGRPSMAPSAFKCDWVLCHKAHKWMINSSNACYVFPTSQISKFVPSHASRLCMTQKWSLSWSPWRLENGNIEAFLSLHIVAQMEVNICKYHHIIRVSAGFLVFCTADRMQSQALSRNLGTKNPKVDHHCCYF